MLQLTHLITSGRQINSPRNSLKLVCFGTCKISKVDSKIYCRKKHESEDNEKLTIKVCFTAFLSYKKDIQRKENNKNLTEEIINN